MTYDDTRPDPPLSSEQISIVESLTKAELLAIDDALISNVSTHWRKISRVVGTTITESPIPKLRLPDVFFAERIRELAINGRLEYRGYLENMRYCEIRLP